MSDMLQGFAQKVRILPISKRRLQYRERSDRMLHATLRGVFQDRFVACSIRSLRSRYCNARPATFCAKPCFSLSLSLPRTSSYKEDDKTDECRTLKTPLSAESRQRSSGE